jgi:hypothetical protein
MKDIKEYWDKTEEDGKKVMEDTKGYRTDAFKIKLKIMIFIIKIN